MEAKSYYYNCSPEYTHTLSHSHRRNAIGGMANFDIARNALITIGLDVPIWLVGIEGE